MITQNILGRIFPFIPLAIGILLVIFQYNSREADAQLPIALMFVLIISCMVSWLFSTMGLLIYKDVLFTYYKTVFTVLSVVYLLPAIILALFVPWTLFFTLAIFLFGMFIVRKNKRVLQ